MIVNVDAAVKYSIRAEILQSSYWEHFKAAKDIARYLDITHPRRIAIESELNRIAKELDIR